MGIVGPSSVIVNAGSLCFFSDDFPMLCLCFYVPGICIYFLCVDVCGVFGCGCNMYGCFHV